LKKEAPQLLTGSWVGFAALRKKGQDPGPQEFSLKNKGGRGYWGRERALAKVHPGRKAPKRREKAENWGCPVGNVAVAGPTTFSV